MDFAEILFDVIVGLHWRVNISFVSETKHFLGEIDSVQINGARVS